MSKVTRMPPETRDTASEIRAQFGGAYVLTLAQIGTVVGYKSRNSTLRWVADLVPRYRGKTRVWLVSDVAEKLCSTEQAS